MQKIKEFIHQTADKLGVKREKIIPFVLAVGLTLTFFLDSQFLDNRMLLVMWIVLGILIVFILTAIMIAAGFTVLKSLFLLSAEISLLIFLAQAYCDVGTTTGHDALRSLIFIGLAYIGYEFFKSLQKALKERLESIPEKRWSWEKFLTVVLFLFFAGTFVWAIYQVSSPVILDLCIYK